jgi:hypothetical protein
MGNSKVDLVVKLVEEEKRFNVPVELRLIINDFVGKINETPVDSMAMDHILISGQNVEDSKKFLGVVEVALRELRICEPIYHGCDKMISGKIEYLRNAKERYKYLVLGDFQYFPPENYELLNSIMRGMRVVVTVFPGFNRLPPDIHSRFRIQVDLDVRENNRNRKKGGAEKSSLTKAVECLFTMAKDGKDNSILIPGNISLFIKELHVTLPQKSGKNSVFRVTLPSSFSV